MPHDELEQEDHGIETRESPAAAAPSAVGTPFVPMAEAVPGAEGPGEFIPDPEGPERLPGIPFPPEGFPFPGGHLPHACVINLRAGCYRTTFRPTKGFTVYYGTMRVDPHGGQTTVSGDLYRYLRYPFTLPVAAARATIVEPIAALPPHAINPGILYPRPYGIPIYPRNRYHSYLKVTNIGRPPILTYGPCRLTLTAEEYVYTQPPAGSFNGSFPPAPGSRTVTIVLEQKPAPPGFTSSYFEGTLYDGGVAKGTFSMGWVSAYFRKA